jgi:hypothetical protein
MPTKRILKQLIEIINNTTVKVGNEKRNAPRFVQPPRVIEYRETLWPGPGGDAPEGGWQRFVDVDFHRRSRARWGR